PSLPVATRCSASRVTPSRSSERSSRNGVTIAVNNRPNSIASSFCLRQQTPPDQLLGDLDGVQGGALAQVVRDAPEAQAVRRERVLAHAADERQVRALGVLRRRIGTAVAVAVA